MASVPVFAVALETCGPWGDAFAIGVSVRGADNREVDSFFAWHPLEATTGFDARRWKDIPRLRAKVIPLLMGTPVCKTPSELRARFWAFYQKWSARRVLVVAASSAAADRLLYTCATEAGREWRPYEFSEFGTPVIDPGSFVKPDRLAEERPEGHPLCDARQTGRLWLVQKAAAVTASMVRA